MEGARYVGRDVRSVIGATRSVVPIVITRLTRNKINILIFLDARGQEKRRLRKK